MMAGEAERYFQIGSGSLRSKVEQVIAPLLGGVVRPTLGVANSDPFAYNFFAGLRDGHERVRTFIPLCSQQRIPQVLAALQALTVLRNW